MVKLKVSDECYEGNHGICSGSGGTMPMTFGGWKCTCMCHIEVAEHKKLEHDSFHRDLESTIAKYNVGGTDVKTLPVDIKEKLLLLQRALVQSNVSHSTLIWDAYHILYSIVDPSFDKASEIGLKNVWDVLRIDDGTN